MQPREKIESTMAEYAIGAMTAVQAINSILDVIADWGNEVCSEHDAPNELYNAISLLGWKRRTCPRCWQEIGKDKEDSP